MRSLTRNLLSLVSAVGLLSCTESPTGPDRALQVSPRMSAVVTPPLVISQVYGGGGNAGATYKNDFIEIFNPGSSAVTMTNWSVQYASSTGSTWQVTTINGTIPAGGYFLVQEAAGTGGTVNLSPNATGTIPMSATAGKVVLANSNTALSGACPTAASVVNLVSFGTGASDCAGAGTTGAVSNTTAAIRKTNGCTFTGSNSADFAIAAPTPRNLASPANVCTVEQPPVASVTVSPPTAEAVVGATQAFTAVGKDASGNAAATTFTWSSSDNAIATVDANGVATAVAAGTATIKAKSANNVEGTATFTVTAPPPTVTADVVISQVYGGGGNSGATYKNDFIELYNRGNEAVNITGWSVQYTSAATNAWQATTLSGTIQPHSYFLVQEAQGAGGTVNLPTPDAVGTLALGATSGKVLLSTTAALASGFCPTGGAIMDKVGYGANSTDNGCASTWGGRTGDLGNSLAAFRKNDGCVKTGVVSSDFVVLSPNPRTSASPVRLCDGQPPRAQSAATLIINELMGDPANAESASWGEWFEVYNYGTQPIDLKDWTIIAGGTSQPDHRISSNVVIPAGGYAILGRGNDITRNGGVTLDYSYFVGNASTIWLDDADFLMLVDNAGARVDSVAWTSLPRGVTKAVRNAAVENADVDGANWGFSSTTFGDGDYGTPQNPNGALANSPPFVSSNTLTFSGRTPTDAPLPVGFEAQVFANEVDQNGTTIPTTISWQSLTPATASIDSRGVIRAIAAGNATFRATATDGTARNLTLTMSTPVASTTADYRNHTEFGDPTDNDPSDDFIVRRTQFTSSFNGPKGIPNWAAYNLNATHITAGQDRCNCFTFDPLLQAAGFAPYTTADYTGAGTAAGYGIDRGHLTRSFDRTSGTLDNASTFYFSNVVPQAADLNQGPWSAFEIYLGDLAQTQNKELYIYTGATGNKGTVKNEGRITIPEYTWKVAVVMPRGKGLADVRDYRDLDVISVIMPNVPGIRNENWQTSYTKTVAEVEQLSGYRLLTALPANIQRALKTGTKPPIAKAGGPYTGVEGSPVTLSGSASVDPNGTIVSYEWSFGDGSTGTGESPSHTFARYGDYTVRLVTTDNDNLVDTTFATVHVTSVPPVIAAFDGAQIVSGASYESTGSFSDVGVGPWSATVNYGDGSGTMPLPLAGSSFSLNHVYASHGTFTVTVSVSDGSTSATQTAAVTVLARPVASTGGPYTVDEGTAIALNASGSTDADGSIVSWDWTFGDASTGAGQSASHTYARYGDYTVRLITTDNDGLADTAVTTVHVAAVAPVIGSITGAQIIAGQTYGASSSFSDVGAGPWTATVDYGDGSGAMPLSLSGSSFTLSHAYGMHGTFTVTVRISDGQAVGTQTAVVTVLARPVAVAGGPYMSNEGASVSLNGSASSDADGSIVTYAWDFGDGSTGSGVSPSHTYAQDGTYSVTLSVTDNDGLQSTATTSVTVSNVAPVIAAFSGATLLAGETYTATGSFTDPGADAWSATVNYGDGASGALTLAGNSFSLNHTYASSGTFTVTVGVNDGTSTGTRSQSVRVLTSAEALDETLVAAVNALLQSGKLSQKDADALLFRLGEARKHLGRGQTNPFVNELNIFTNDLDKLVKSGKLAAADAAPLKAAVARIDRSLGF